MEENDKEQEIIKKTQTTIKEDPSNLNLMKKGDY